jgi:HEAT repeat protein
MTQPPPQSQEVAVNDLPDQPGPVVLARATTFVMLLFAFWVTCLPSVFAQAAVDKAWSAIEAGVTDKGTDDRAASVRILGLIQNNPKAAELALKALQDDKPEVRAAAADAIGQMRAKSAVPKLHEIIKADKEPSVVMAGARSLIALGDPDGYAVYYAVLTGEKKSGGGLLDEQKKILKDPKKMAAFGFDQGMGYLPLGGIGVGAFKALTKDDASPVRAAAAKILAKDSDPKSGEALVEASSDKSWLVRAAALDALCHRGDPSVLPQVEAELDDDKDVVRLTAAAATIHLHDIKPVQRKK